MPSTQRNRSRLGSVVGALIGLVLGAAFLGAGLWARSSTRPLDDGVIVVGTVVDIDERTDSDGDRTYAPIVDYVDPATGRTHRLAGVVATGSRPQLGSSRDVSLRPGDPGSARVVGPAWFPWIFIGVGAGALSVTATGFVIAARRRRSSAGVLDSSVVDHPIVPGAVSPAPGFHPDPGDGGRYRYWDGSRWTDDYAPMLFED
jgi:hypothetical protein